MRTPIRFVQIVRGRMAPSGGTVLTFGGAPLSFGGVALTFQPA